jgi:hypothetical protein
MGNHGSLAVIAALTTRFLIGKRTAFCLYHHAGGVLMCTAIGADGLNLHMIMLFLQTVIFTGRKNCTSLGCKACSSGRMMSP